MTFTVRRAGMTRMNGTVFVSDSRKDTPATFAVAGLLRRAGHAASVNRAGIEGGTRWSEEFVAALKGCDAVVFYLSPASAASINIAREVAIVSEEGRPLVPVRLAPADELASRRPGRRVRHRPPPSASAWTQPGWLLGCRPLPPAGAGSDGVPTRRPAVGADTGGRADRRGQRPAAAGHPVGGPPRPAGTRTARRRGHPGRCGPAAALRGVRIKAGPATLAALQPLVARSLVVLAE